MMYFRVLIFLILSLFTLSVCAKTLIGEVIKVSDGDTIIIKTKQSKKVRIRLAEIDAPEMAQPYGKTAQQALNSLLLSKTVLIEYKSKDRYQRIVGRVYLDNIDICAEMVSKGHVWVYTQYSNDLYLFCLEYWARLNHKGLWALPPEQRTPPWMWRRLKSQSTPVFSL